MQRSNPQTVLSIETIIADLKVSFLRKLNKYGLKDSPQTFSKASDTAVKLGEIKGLCSQIKWSSQ